MGRAVAGKLLTGYGGIEIILLLRASHWLWLAHESIGPRFRYTMRKETMRELLTVAIVLAGFSVAYWLCLFAWLAVG